MNTREKNMLVWLENYCAGRPCDWGTNAALSMARALFCVNNPDEKNSSIDIVPEHLKLWLKKQSQESYAKRNIQSSRAYMKVSEYIARYEGCNALNSLIETDKGEK